MGKKKICPGCYTVMEEFPDAPEGYTMVPVNGFPLCVPDGATLFRTATESGECVWMEMEDGSRHIISNTPQNAVFP